MHFQILRFRSRKIVRMIATNNDNSHNGMNRKCLQSNASVKSHAVVAELVGAQLTVLSSLRCRFEPCRTLWVDKEPCGLAELVRAYLPITHLIKFNVFKAFLKTNLWQI